MSENNNLNGLFAAPVGTISTVGNYVFYSAGNSRIIPIAAKADGVFYFNVPKKINISRPVLIETGDLVKKTEGHYYAVDVKDATHLRYKNIRAFYRAVSETGEACPKLLLETYKRLGVEVSSYKEIGGKTYAFIPDLSSENLSLTYLGYAS